MIERSLLMTELIYTNDGEFEENSHTLQLQKAISIAELGTSGKNLSDALNSLVNESSKVLMDTFTLLEDIADKKIVMIHDKVTPDEKSEKINVETYRDEDGNIMERDISDVLKSRKPDVISEKRYEKIANAIKNLGGMEAKDSIFKTNLMRFFEDLKDSFITMPTVVPFVSINRLQFTWVRRDKVKAIANVSPTKYNFYISFRDVDATLDTVDIVITSLSNIKTVLKVLGFFSA